MLKNVTLPDVSVPDTSGITAEIKDLAESAVDAVSSAAGHVPGLDDFRAVNRRRRRLVWSLGALGVICIVLLMIKKNQETGDSEG